MSVVPALLSHIAYAHTLRHGQTLGVDISTAAVWRCTAGVRRCTAGVWGCTANVWGCTANVWGCTADARLHVDAQLVYVDVAGM